MATTKPADTKRESVLDRAKRKQAVLDELYAKIGPAEPGSHRPLTPEERKLQAANALTATETEALRVDLYAHWVALDDIYIGGALAFVAGQRVPTTHVEGGIVERDAVEPVEADKVAEDA